MWTDSHTHMVTYPMDDESLQPYPCYCHTQARDTKPQVKLIEAGPGRRSPEGEALIMAKAGRF